MLLARRPDLGYSVSCTTRAPRTGEVAARDYYFMSRAEFIAKREQGAFAESAEVHGNLYGTLRSGSRTCDERREARRHGHRRAGRGAVHSRLPAVGDDLHPSAVGRGAARAAARAANRSPAQLAARSSRRLQELQRVDEYEYVVVNDDLERAVASVESIIDAEVVSRERLKNLRQQVGLLIERLEQEIENSTP